MFSGGNRNIAPTYHVADTQLSLRPYNAKLGALTESVCAAIDGGSDRCLFETRTAFDCVLRGKVQQYGANMDNIGDCKHHIQNAKDALGQGSWAAIDSQVEKLHFARQSFV